MIEEIQINYNQYMIFMKPVIYLVWLYFKSFNKGLIKIVCIKVFMHVFLFLCTETTVSWLYQMHNYDTLLNTIKINSLGSEKIVKLKNHFFFIWLVFRNTTIYGSVDFHEARRVIFCKSQIRGNSDFQPF